MIIIIIYLKSFGCSEAKYDEIRREEKLFYITITQYLKMLSAAASFGWMEQQCQ